MQLRLSLIIGFPVALCMATRSTINTEAETFPHGLFSIRPLVHLEDLANLISSFDSEFRARKDAVFSRPMPELLEECYPMFLLYDWARAEISFLDSISEFGSEHLKGAWKEEFDRRRDEVSNRYIASSVLTPLEGQRLYSELQIFRRLYAEYAASGETKLTSTNGADLTPASADLREFHLLTMQIEKTLIQEAFGPEVFRLISESQRLLDEIVAAKLSPSDDVILKVIGMRNLASQQIGYPDYFSETIQQGALDAFERSKGRSTLVHYSLESSPVVRFLRAAYRRIVVDGLHTSFKHGLQEYVNDCRQYLEFPEELTLLEVLTGLSLVAKGLLNVQVEVDFEEDLWSDSSFVLKVTRVSHQTAKDSHQAAPDGRQGATESRHDAPNDYQAATEGSGTGRVVEPSIDVLGRIFVQLTASSSRVLKGSRPRTREMPGEPSIVLMNVYGLSIRRNSNDPTSHGSNPNSRDSNPNSYGSNPNSFDLNSDSSNRDCDLSSRSIESLRACRLDTMSIYHMFHEMTHALHYLLSNLRLIGSSAPSGFTDYLELPSQLFEYFVRDWLDFVKGRSLASDLSPIPGEFSSPLQMYLYPAMASHAMWLGEDHTDLAVLFGDSSISQTDVQNYPFLPFVSLKTDYGLYIIDRALGLMVYKKGEYRRKLWSLFEQYKSRLGELKEHMGESEKGLGESGKSVGKLHNNLGMLEINRGDDIGRLDAHKYVDSLPGEHGMRSFFASGIVNQNFQSFLSIVPGLEKVLDEADYLDEAVDFEPYIDELRLKSPLCAGP